MKTSWHIKLGLVVAIAVAVPAGLRADTTDVFQVHTTLSGTIQRGVVSNSIISKVIIKTDDLVNLAQRRALGTPVPQNEVLALTSDCSTNDPQPSQLIIFDTNAKANLLTIGTLSNLTASTFTRRRYVETMTQIAVNDTSDGTNGITGGSFYYHGKIKITTNGCPISFSGQWTGFLGTVFPYTATNIFYTNFVISCQTTNCAETNCIVSCTNRVDLVTNIFPSVIAYDVIIPRTPVTTGKSIGTLAE